jgi:hypothetical protein
MQDDKIAAAALRCVVASEARAAGVEVRALPNAPPQHAA